MREVARLTPGIDYNHHPPGLPYEAPGKRFSQLVELGFADTRWAYWETSPWELGSRLLAPVKSQGDASPGSPRCLMGQTMGGRVVELRLAKPATYQEGWNGHR